MKNRLYNFNAGPAVLPETVLQESKAAILNYDNTGIGILEMSHRSGPFKKIALEAKDNLKKILSIGDDFEVLFLHGGASLQFHMLPLNIAHNQKTAYINTGVWSNKAIKEAARLGSVLIAASSEDLNFSYIPSLKSDQLDNDLAYLHFTSNNTIYGTQFQSEPDSNDILLACDASSDFLSRRIDMDRYGIIYAGAQKNLGPAGLCVVVIRKEWLSKSPDDLPLMLSYANHAKSESMFNTPPAFSLYVAGLVFKWILHSGGLVAIEKLNQEKSDVLYSVLDKSNFYTASAEKGSRSLMNVTFRLPTTDLEDKFIAEALQAGFSGLKGHRLVGGIRASIYNAFPLQGIKDFVAFMQKFESANLIS